MTSVELKDHFFRLQTSQEIPVDGNLSQVPIELCHQYSIIETLTGMTLGTSPGEGILSIGTPEELELDFPGFAERMEWIKIVLITKAMQKIAALKAARENPPLPEETLGL